MERNGFGFVSSKNGARCLNQLLERIHSLKKNTIVPLERFCRVEDQLMSTRQFCKVALNLDVVRGLEIDAVASMEELDKTIYGIFNKNEIVQTKLMKKRKDNMKAIGHRLLQAKRSICPMRLIRRMLLTSGMNTPHT